MKTGAMLYVTIGIVGVVSIIFLLVVLFVLMKDKKRRNGTRYIKFFGTKISMNDYNSFINTCICYLVSSYDNKLDLHLFLDDKLLSGRYWKYCAMIEDSINTQSPIIECTYCGNGIFKVLTNRTAVKYADYQNRTGCDDYIIPLFDNNMVQRNPKLFNMITRCQQMKSYEAMESKFDAIEKALRKVTLNDSDVKEKEDISIDEIDDQEESLSEE